MPSFFGFLPYLILKINIWESHKKVFRYAHVFRSLHWSPISLGLQENWHKNNCQERRKATNFCETRSFQCFLYMRIIFIKVVCRNPSLSTTSCKWFNKEIVVALLVNARPSYALVYGFDLPLRNLVFTRLGWRCTNPERTS